jgi:tellurite resistance protein TerC
LFFLVTGLLARLVYLSTGLALVLAFIGVKLVLHWAHTVWHSVPEISTGLSLAVIGVILAVTTVASLLKSRGDPTSRAHAGAVLGVAPLEAAEAAGTGVAGGTGMAEGTRASGRTRATGAAGVAETVEPSTPDDTDSTESKPRPRP